MAFFFFENQQLITFSITKIKWFIKYRNSKFNLKIQILWNFLKNWPSAPIFPYSVVEITIFHEVAPIKNFLKFKIWNSASAKILARHIFAAFLKFSETFWKFDQARPFLLNLKLNQKSSTTHLLHRQFFVKRTFMCLLDFEQC